MFLTWSQSDKTIGHILAPKIRATGMITLSDGSRGEAGCDLSSCRLGRQEASALEEISELAMRVRSSWTPTLELSSAEGGAPHFLHLKSLGGFSEMIQHLCEEQEVPAPS